MSLRARAATIIALAVLWPVDGLADDIVRVVSTAPVLSNVRNLTLSGSVASNRNGRPTPKSLGVTGLMDADYFSRLMDQRSEADAALRRSGWSAAFLMEGWKETWKTLPDGRGADQVPLFSAIEFAARKCLEEAGEETTEDAEDSCQRAIFGSVNPSSYDCDDEICEYSNQSTDYENIFWSHGGAPLSIQLKALRQNPIGKKQLDRLSQRSTAILESIRASLPAGADACAEKPVEVVGYDEQSADAGLNVTASFCARELRVPIRIIEDIWARAVFRAVRYNAIFLSDFYYKEALADVGTQVHDESLVRLVSVVDPPIENVVVTASETSWFTKFGPDKRDALREMRREGVYSASLQSYVDLLMGMPSFEYPTILAGDLAREIRSTRDQGIVTRWEDFLSRAEAEPQAELFDLLDVDDTRSLFADLRANSPKKPRDKNLTRYLAWLDEAYRESGSNKRPLLYANLLSELLSLSARVELEVYKGLVFVLAHESWHLWMSNLNKKISACKREEMNADAHAVRMFLIVAPKEPNIEPLLKEFDSLDDTSKMSLEEYRDIPRDDLFKDVLGRDPDVLLKEVYAGTRYEKTYCHPPLDERVSSIRSLIQGGREGLTQNAIDEMRSLLNDLAIGHR